MLCGPEYRTELGTAPPHTSHSPRILTLDEVPQRADMQRGTRAALKGTGPHSRWGQLVQEGDTPNLCTL